MRLSGTIDKSIFSFLPLKIHEYDRNNLGYFHTVSGTRDQVLRWGVVKIVLDRTSVHTRNAVLRANFAVFRATFAPEQDCAAPFLKV